MIARLAPDSAAPRAARILLVLLAVSTGCASDKGNPAHESRHDAGGAVGRDAGHTQDESDAGHTEPEHDAGKSQPDLDAGHDGGAMSDAGTDAGHEPLNGTFRAPLSTGPDPFMVFHEGFYYLATTGGSSIRMWKAASLGELLNAPPTVVWQGDDPSRNQQMWAPSFALFDGHWYLYFTADDGVDDHHRIHVVESEGTDPLGPYHYKNRLVAKGNEEVWAIDQEVLKQDSGLYLMWSGAGSEGHNLIYIAPMENPYTVSGSRVYLPAKGGCPEVREGPAVLQHGDTSFVVYSTCDTGKPDYQLWMMSIPKNKDPLVPGNWTQHQSAVLTRNDAGGVYGPGHNGFFKSPDGSEDWLVYHAKNTTTFTYDRRTTRALKIRWNDDGTPDFGVPPALGYTLDLPAGDPGGGPYWINDTNSSSGKGSVAFAGAWTAYPSCGVQCFWGDDHGSTTADATATFSFEGTQIALLSVSDAGNGIAAISIDDGDEKMVDFYASIRQGEQLQYMSPKLPYGSHHLRVRVTGQKRDASSGLAISIDRAEVYTR